MAIGKNLAVLVLVTSLGVPALAQQSDRDMRDAEEQQRAAEKQMREAEDRLAEAARTIAELSTRQLPAVVDIQRRIQGDDRAVLGITIMGDERQGPVEGVTVRGVTPGGAADEAGLRAGDVITTVNGESMTADSDEQANSKLVEFMSGVEEGDILDVDYLRKGKQSSVQIRPRAMGPMPFVHSFPSGPGNFVMPMPPDMPGSGSRWYAWRSDGSGWGHMEMVTLTKRLGSYFGTDKGVLVVRAPDNEKLQLEDGDVIQTIDGREPKSVAHAMRILGSYQSGEELELRIMRDKKARTLKITMPENQRTSELPPDTLLPSGSGALVAPRVHTRTDRRT